MSFPIRAALLGLACLAPATSVAQAQEPVLTREAAIARALGDDPRLPAADAARSAAEAGVRAAALRPNPSLDVTMENVAGSGPYHGVESAETTFALSQPIELGGDRAARRAVAESDLDAARIDGDLVRLDLIADVERAFIDAQAAAAALVIAEAALAVERELGEAAAERVAQARDPALVGARAEARVAAAELEVERAHALAEAARARLVSWWGGEGDFSLDQASFERLDAHAQGDPDAAPDLALAEVARERAEAELDLERARRVPDPSVEAGLRYLGDTDESAFVVGFSVPLPVWDDNTQGVARARAQALRVEREAEAAVRALTRERDLLEAERDAARLEAEGLQARVLPQAEEALSAARRAFAAAGASYLEVLETHEALTEMRARRVEALRSFHHADAGLARLTGAHAAASEEISP